MFLLTRSLLALAGVILLFTAPLSADAQVVVHMQTAQGECVASSSGGLQILANSSDWEIHGGETVLAGPGCGTGGNGDFSAVIQAGSNAQVGTPFQLQWYVNDPTAATRCYYTADRNSMAATSNWPVGAVACSGTGCPTITNKKSESINFSGTGSSFRYGILCSNETGLTQSGEISVSGAPAGAPVFGAGSLTMTPSAAALGSPFAVKWTVTNAASCTGSAKRDGQTVQLSGWTGSVAPNAGTGSGLSLTPQAEGVYALTLVCDNGATPGETAQATGQFTVNAAPVDNCVNPQNRLTAGNITYWYNSPAGNTDLKEWVNIFGRYKGSDSITTTWPGVPLSIPKITWLDQNKYIAAHFTVSGTEPVTLIGDIIHYSNNPGPRLDSAISKTCGDFDNTVGSYCSTSKRGPGGIMMLWRMPQATGNYCVLPPGDYYLNIRMNNPADAANDLECTDTGGGIYRCNVTVQSRFSTQ
mgnify:CR=1 FL=1